MPWFREVVIHSSSYLVNHFVYQLSGAWRNAYSTNNAWCGLFHQERNGQVGLDYTFFRHSGLTKFKSCKDVKRFICISFCSLFNGAYCKGSAIDSMFIIYTRDDF